MTLPKDWAGLMSGIVELGATVAVLRDRVQQRDTEIARLQIGIAKHVDRICELQARLAGSDALLRDCDAIARARGDKYGLCDAIDNDGNSYQSAGLAAHLHGADKS